MLTGSNNRNQVAKVLVRVTGIPLKAETDFLKCYCDENFVFSFPVFLSVISYLDPKFHESAKFFTI